MDFESLCIERCLASCWLLVVSRGAAYWQLGLQNHAVDVLTTTDGYLSANQVYRRLCWMYGDLLRKDAFKISKQKYQYFCCEQTHETSQSNQRSDNFSVIFPAGYYVVWRLKRIAVSKHSAIICCSIIDLAGREWLDSHKFTAGYDNLRRKGASKSQLKHTGIFGVSKPSKSKNSCSVTDNLPTTTNNNNNNIISRQIQTMLATVFTTFEPGWNNNQQRAIILDCQWRFSFRSRIEVCFLFQHRLLFLVD